MLSWAWSLPYGGYQRWDRQSCVATVVMCKCSLVNSKHTSFIPGGNRQRKAVFSRERTNGFQIAWNHRKQWGRWAAWEKGCVWPFWKTAFLQAACPEQEGRRGSKKAILWTAQVKGLKVGNTVIIRILKKQSTMALAQRVGSLGDNHWSSGHQRRQVNLVMIELGGRWQKGKTIKVTSDLRWKTYMWGDPEHRPIRSAQRCSTETATPTRNEMTDTCFGETAG